MERFDYPSPNAQTISIIGVTQDLVGMVSSKSQLIKELKQALSSAIADFKAYEVPSVCERVGLMGGTEEEAFRSKSRYASSRLQSLRIDEVVDVAKRFLEHTDNFSISELLAKIEEQDFSQVSELTRRRVISIFEGSPLSTELDEIEFIKLVWPVSEMPSPYSGTYFDQDGSLEEAIYQHTIRNDDWTQQELLQYLGVLTCSQAQFFRFLEQVTDPMVQKQDRQKDLVEAINSHLKHDGFFLKIKRAISGSPIYAVTALQLITPSDAGISATLKAFDPDSIHERWEQALERRTNDPEGAITLSRTLLEDVCKWIIHAADESYSEKDDLPALYGKLANILNLAPDGHTEQIFKQILGNCQSIVQSLGALRNKLSDSHSRGPVRAKPSARHAELAVNLAGTMATFLVATWTNHKARM